MLAMNGLNSSTPSSDVKYPPNVANQRGLSAAELDVDKLYEPKQNRKIVRIFTVILYMFSVSLGAILLSLYYVFIWKNPHTSALDRADNLTDTDFGSGDLLLDVSSPGPQALVMDTNSFNINQEDGQVIPATAFPKKSRGIPPVMDKTRQKRNTRRLIGQSWRLTKGRHKKI